MEFISGVFVGVSSMLSVHYGFITTGTVVRLRCTIAFSHSVNHR